MGEVLGSQFSNTEAMLAFETQGTDELMALSVANQEAYKTAEAARIKKKAHSGKVSDQEKSANERNTTVINYNQATATNVLNSYNEKKRQISVPVVSD